MFKLLVNAPSGVQEVVEVDQGGGYLPLEPWRKLWDEREDGVLPTITLGGMVRQGSTLVFDQDRMDEHNAVVLAAGRAQAWASIKAHRERLSDQGGYKVVVNGVDKWFHSDAKSKTQQLGLVIAGAAVPAIQWKTMDGTFVTMSQALAGAIFQAAAAQDAAIFTKAEQHKAAMEASPDPLAYDFSGGWPATFGG